MNLESELVGQSSSIKRLRREIPQLAGTQRHILIRGEAGTGKGMIGRLIHTASSSKPTGLLVTLTATSSSEAEIKEAVGKVNADVSTILLQEIEGFSFVQQASINSFIQNLPRKPFVRVIVTAKQPLGELEKDGKILDGLAETLKGFETVSVPPLGQRTVDIPLLVQQFVKYACESIGSKLKSLDINAVDFLVRREWNENIRELKSVVEKAVLTSVDRDVIELPQYLIDEYSQLEGLMSNIKDRRAFAFDKSLANLERTLIERALDTVGYNQSKAAAILNLSEANLRYRLKKFRIPTSREK